MALACWGWCAAGGGQYRERALLVLAFVPFLAFGMQSYGGEMALRVFLFALPGAAVLGGAGPVPAHRRHREERDKDRVSLAPLAALLAGLLLVGGFLVARWGNEPFERIRPGEVAAMDYVYAHDHPTVRLLWLSDDPVERRDAARCPGARRTWRGCSTCRRSRRADPVLVSGLVKSLRDAGPQSYLMVNHSQSVYLRLDAGYPANWEARLHAATWTPARSCGGCCPTTMRRCTSCASARGRGPEAPIPARSGRR